MKTLRIFACLILALLLGACATQSTNSNEPRTSTDYTDQYIYAVEKAARDQGVLVLWANPPERKKTEESDGS